MSKPFPMKQTAAEANSKQPPIIIKPHPHTINSWVAKRGK